MARPREEAVSRPGGRTGLALGLDLIAVALFTLFGRLSHDEPLDLDGWWSTAWPFLAGLAIGWLVVVMASRTWPTRLSHGLPVWLSTVGGGMALRGLAGQGTAVPFVIVATLFLAATLLGWRLVLWLIERR